MWTEKGIPDVMLYAVTTTELYKACEGIAHVTLRERAKSINQDRFHFCTATQGIRTGNLIANGDGSLLANKKCLGFIWRVAPEAGYTFEVGLRSVFPLTVASAWHAARHCHPHTITTMHMGIGPDNVLRSLGQDAVKLYGDANIFIANTGITILVEDRALQSQASSISWPRNWAAVPRFNILKHAYDGSGRTTHEEAKKLYALQHRVVGAARWFPQTDRRRSAASLAPCRRPNATTPLRRSKQRVVELVTLFSFTHTTRFMDIRSDGLHTPAFYLQRGKRGYGNHKRKLWLIQVVYNILLTSLHGLRQTQGTIARALTYEIIPFEAFPLFRVHVHARGYAQQTQSAENPASDSPLPPHTLVTTTRHQHLPHPRQHRPTPPRRSRCRPNPLHLPPQRSILPLHSPHLRLRFPHPLV
ncbi:uncharacterized protein EV422DRAFT_340150 [Fimicolochytrium jonesii]|uniref:uncharacterized protein n=1 Tax=Fimicolochytrium jonesii TaxID=1396493 RepID=UPI0022FDC15D|nr:uncharacterized protein EV422DRAFT_340150 [Fimicolochytrium jonesii]KAI8815892.1 hypothetical protein EV422DRAFT_340150 [Fimicolochytrium jonesii]